MNIITTLDKNPIVIASLRLLETSVVVTLITFFTQLAGALQTPDGLGSYDWRGALTALGLGVASGLVNAIITLLNLWKQSASATKGP